MFELRRENIFFFEIFSESRVLRKNREKNTVPNDTEKSVPRQAATGVTSRSH